MPDRAAHLFPLLRGHPENHSTQETR